jgi:hypothetical protein
MDVYAFDADEALKPMALVQHIVRSMSKEQRASAAFRLRLSTEVLRRRLDAFEASL